MTTEAQLPTARKDEDIVCPTGTVCGRILRDVAGKITGADFSALELDTSPATEQYVCSCCGKPVAVREQEAQWRVHLRRGWVS